MDNQRNQRVPAFFGQLDNVYPVQGEDNRNVQEYEALSQRFLRDVVGRSATPVVMVWKPNLSDFKWAFAEKEFRNQRRKARGDEEAIARAWRARREKVKNVGHAVIAWKNINDSISYVSFWPSGRNGEMGEFRTFFQDLVAEKTLPHRIFVSLLGKRYGTLFLGKYITNWNINRLQTVFALRRQAPPIFDLRARNNAHNCSTTVMSMIESSVTTDQGEKAKQYGKAFGHILSKGPILARIAGFLGGLVLLPATFIIDHIGTGIEVGIKQAVKSRRENGTINPNYISGLFKSEKLGFQNMIYERKEDKRDELAPCYKRMSESKYNLR